MSWLVRLLGIEKARAAFARLAAAVDLFTQDFEAAAAKLRGKAPAALGDKGKKPKAADAAGVAP
jgi:hypothetical protein